MMLVKKQSTYEKSISAQTISMNSEEQQIMQRKLMNLNEVTVKLLEQLTLMESSSKKVSTQVKLRLLSDINANINQMFKINPLSVEIFAEQSIIIYVRRILAEATTPKIQALQFFRIIMVSEKVAIKLIKYCLPVYIARVIERDQGNKKFISSANYDDEAFEALRLINHWIDKFPITFPQYLAFCLVAFAQLSSTPISDERDKKDQISQFLKNYAIDILLNLSSKNTKLCCRCGGFSLLINQIINSPQKSPQIMNRIIIFINDKKNREITEQYIDLNLIFYVLTDLDNVFYEENLKNRNLLEQLARFQTKVMLAKNAIITLMKSWSGLIFLGNNPQALFSLLEALKQIPKKIESEIRNAIFQCLQQVLNIGDSIITSTAMKNQFKISNLIGCYLMSVIQLLIEQNILRLLIQFSGIQEPSISQPSQRLLKRITLLIFNFRPESSKYIDFLITAASQNQTHSISERLKSSSSFVINKISNYIYDKKSKANHVLFNQLENLFSLRTIFIPYERASVNSIAKSLNFITYKEKQNYRKELFEMFPVPKDYKQDYRFWKWDIIQNLLSFPDPQKYKASNSDRFRENKLYKYLLRFYSPSRGDFSKLEWEHENFKYHKVGMLMIKNTITIPENLPLIKNPPQSQFECTISFIGDLEKMLEICISQSFIHYPNLKLFKTMQRQLLGYIGLLSQNKVGYEALLYENNFFQLIYSCLHREQCSHLIYIILMSLDFFRDDMIKNPKSGPFLQPTKSSFFQSTSSFLSNPLSTGADEQFSRSIIIGPRALLKRCINDGSYSLKTASIQVIKILLMSELPQFSLYCYRLLIKMLKQFDTQSEIVQTIIQLLQQNLAHKKNVDYFLKVLGESPKNQEKKINVGPNFGKSRSYNNVSQPDQMQYSKEKSKEKSHQKNMKKHKHKDQRKKNITFVEIKHKLSSEIMILLLSNEAGFDLIQRECPDWLESQYKIWCPIRKTGENQPNKKKTKKQHYCLKLEAKLAKALNFNSTKSKEKNCYRVKNSITLNNSSDAVLYDLLFVYKLPWIIWVNGKQYPLWVKKSKHSYTLFREFFKSPKADNLPEKMELGRNTTQKEEQKQYPVIFTNDDSVKILLAIGNMIVDEEFNLVDTENRNSMNDYKANPLNVFLSINAKQVEIHGERLWMVQSNGVEIYYQKGKYKHLNKLYIRRINIRIKISITQNCSELPLHLIHSLAKTKKGQNFINNKKFVQYCYSILSLGSLNQLQNSPFTPLDSTMPAPSLVQLRSILWALGFYGSTNFGIKILYQYKIFDIILEFSKRSHTLSLRGTCRYVMDMFCHSDNGRALLLQNGFYVNNNCYSCYPLNTRSLYQISRSTLKHKHSLQDEKYWNFYETIMKDHPMSKNEEKLFELISMLISSFSSKLATNQLKQILRVSPKISNSVNLFQNTVTLLSYFKLKHENRKVVMSLFDQLLRSGILNSSNISTKSPTSQQQNNSNTNNTVKFYLGEYILPEQSKVKESQ